jgi:hypothetical protein
VKKTAPATTDPTVSFRKEKKETQSDKFLKLCEYIEVIRQGGLTGHIKVNFNQGNICKIEKYEEILRD